MIVRARLSRTSASREHPGRERPRSGCTGPRPLYAYRDQLGRAGVLVVGPNASFLSTSASAAGTGRDRRHTGVGVLPRHRGDRRPDPRARPGACGGDSRAMRGWPRCCGRAVWSQVRSCRRRRWWCRGVRTAGGSAAYQAEELVIGFRTRGIRTAPAGRCCRNGWPTPSSCGWRRPATSPTTACRTRSPAADLKQYAEQLWPAVDRPKLLFRLFTDTELLAEPPTGILDSGGQAMLTRHVGAPFGRYRALVGCRRRP